MALWDAVREEEQTMCQVRPETVFSLRPFLFRLQSLTWFHIDLLPFFALNVPCRLVAIPDALSGMVNIDLLLFLQMLAVCP
jgi:hypothetical protein